MKRILVRFLQNVDVVVPLALGIVISCLGALDLTSSHVVENSIVVTLTVLSFALLRDRWSKESAEQSAQQASDAVLGMITDVRSRLHLVETLGAQVAAVEVAMEGLSAVAMFKGPEIEKSFTAARVRTDRWMFKGGTGTYTRAATLPRCIEAARRERRELLVRLEILDPTDDALCERYARYRTSLSPRPDGTGEVWTADRTKKESFATVLAAHWYERGFQLLDIGVGLTRSLSTFRFDISSNRVIITQDDVQFPAMQILDSSPLYDAYVTELRTSFAQARRVPLESAATVHLSPQPTCSEARNFFAAVGVSLPQAYGDEDVQEIIAKAILAKNPYE